MKAVQCRLGSITFEILVQWIRRVFIAACAIGSGTTFLYIKQNIHDLKAVNFEGDFEEFDHPFALLFCVYLFQMIIFSIVCLLNGPIRNQLVADISQLKSTVSNLIWRCFCGCCTQDENRDAVPGDQQNLLNGGGNAQNHDEHQAQVFVLPAANVNPHHNNGDDPEEEEGFIKLFVNGDEKLRVTNYLPPAFLMFLSTSFMYYAFGATYPATIVMFRAVSLAAAGVVRCRCMCASIRIRKEFSIRQWLAVAIMIAAIVHSAYYDWMTSKRSHQRTDISYLVTVPLLSVAHIGIALSDTYDEKFLHERRGIPLIMCFVESTLGTILYAVMLPILYLIPDPLYPTTQGGVMENALNAFVQMSNNPKIVVFVVVLAASETIWMAARAFITRYANAVVKTIIDSLQLVFVRYVTPELYVCSEQSEPTTVFTVVVFALGIAVFYFSEKPDIRIRFR